MKNNANYLRPQWHVPNGTSQMARPQWQRKIRFNEIKNRHVQLVYMPILSLPLDFFYGCNASVCFSAKECELTTAVYHIGGPSETFDNGNVFGIHCVSVNNSYWINYFFFCELVIHNNLLKLNQRLCTSEYL